MTLRNALELFTAVAVVLFGLHLSATSANAQCAPGRIAVVVPSGRTICLPAAATHALGGNSNFVTATPTAIGAATATVTATQPGAGSTPTLTSTSVPAETPTITPSDIPTDTPAATPTVTPTPCRSSGVAVGGFCWYLGAPGESCDVTCAGVGAVCDAATITFAGSGGTNTNCMSVLAALAITDPFTESMECLGGYGCADIPGFVSARCSAPPTTCAAAASNVQRACACNE